MNDYSFGNFICRLRTEKGLSQSQLGDMMGVSNKAVSKWEMGVSKPRPAMLVSLASFFGLTVEELLAGERKAEAEQRESEIKHEKVLKLWIGEYRKKKTRGLSAVLTAVMLPIIMFICVGVIIEFNLMEDIVGPIVVIVFFLAEAIDISLIFVFYGSARRLKRILYATYPEQTEQITNSILHKKVKLPMLKWERICLIAGACTLLMSFVFRTVYCFVDKKGIILVMMMLQAVALVLYIISMAHYCFRCRRNNNSE